MVDTYPKPTARAIDDFEQYLPLLLGAIDAELMRSVAWTDEDRQDALLYMDDLKSYLMTLPEILTMPGESHLDIWHMFAEVVLGGAITRTIHTAQAFNHYAAQATPALNDQWRHYVYLDKGSYRFRMVYEKFQSCGQVLINIITPDAQHTAFGETIDFYAASAIYNNVFSADFVVDFAGRYEVYGQVTGKHASATGYNIPITSIHLWRYG